MTIRDHRLTGAAKRWARGQLQAPPRRRLERATKAITRRVKRTGDKTNTTDKKGEEE